MKIFLEKAFLINRAPFEKLELDFNENSISVLLSESGKGKTTILSHIVDAFHEMARLHFKGEFEGKENKFYRISSAIYNIDPDKPSFVYFRFKLSELCIDYVDIINVCTEQDYEEAISLENKIPFNTLKSKLESSGYLKKFSGSFNKENAEKVFFNNLITSFPSYRFETPGYLNDPYLVSLNFTKKSGFSGRLVNPIEVVSGLSEFANWMMDIVLDIRVYSHIQSQILFQQINAIITHALAAKNKGKLAFAIGPRGFGGARIQIFEDKINGKQVYPTIFNLSSGEASLLCLFGELLRQADNLRNNIQAHEITGIVLVDEIDKHLHIKLQKEILPLLLEMFPNIQFIVSSHSPFLSLGLAEKLQDRSRLIDIGSGVSIQPINDPQYQEVYEMMLGENENYKLMYESILSQIEDTKELQIITEGKNTEHIKKAITILDQSILSRISIVTGAENKTGEQQLKNAFVILANAKHTNKFLFVWDCDSAGIADSVTESSSFFKFIFTKNYNNNKVKKGIENLYPENLFTNDVYEEKITRDDYGGSKTEIRLNKDFFLRKIQEIHEREVFVNFSSLLEKILSIINPSSPEN